MSEHAHLSPSGAHRSLRCPASLQAEALVPDYDSDYAAEGTRAHTAAACVLNGDLEAVVYDDDEMAKHVASYVKLVREYALGGTLLVEQKVDFGKFMFDDGPRPMIEIVDKETGEILSEEASAFGTSDAVILKPALEQLVMIDLKYGMGVKVDAEENEQLMCYALGCLHEFDYLGPFKEIVLVIHQPRLKHVSEWVISTEQLLAFGERAKLGFAVALGPNPPFIPGKKQCKFCNLPKATGGCAAQKAEALAPVGEDVDLTAFESLALSVAEAKDQLKQNLKAVPDEDLGRRMHAVELAEIWCKGVRAEMETRMLLQGVQVPGWKIVQGRQGDRKWTNEEEVAAQLKKWRVKDDEAFKKKLISPPQAQTVFEGSPKRWEALQAFITRSDGKPSVAPDEDSRPAIKGNVDLEAFAVIADQTSYV